MLFTVASYADAWIEICGDTDAYYPEQVSHPTRMRGLKWKASTSRSSSAASHPTRMRGLKYRRHEHAVARLESHPTRMRGLKYPALDHLYRVPRVASYADAWIEMRGTKSSTELQSVASYADAWIEIRRMLPYINRFQRRILRGCVD